MPIKKKVNFEQAYITFKSAIDTVELLRGEIKSGDEAKQKLAEEWNRLYLNMVKVCLELGNDDQAIEYVERSKARNLVELIATRDLKPKGDIPKTILNQLSRLRREIHSEQRRLEIEEKSRTNQVRMSSEEGRSQEYTLPLTIPNRSHLNQLQQQLDELIARDITPKDSSFSLTQKVDPIPFSDIQALTDDRTAIIEWYITNDKILTFIITHHSPQPILWQSTSEDLEALVESMNAYLSLYYSENQWHNQLPSRLQKFADILHLDEILSHIPKQCGSEALLQADRLILIPHRFLHLLPIHAIPMGSQKSSAIAATESKVKSQNFTSECLLDRFPGGVRYAPSCQLLKLAQNQQRPDFQNLFAIQNPTGDLIYTDLEVETIRSFFSSTQVLVKQAATKTALDAYQDLPSVHCSHFSCHGTFNIASPLESALLLANNELLTLGEIFQLSLTQCRLVTLSACETGLTDFNSFSDEYIGLPSGFLFAGSPSVISSLWTVSDLSTAFLMIKFYENLHQSPQLQEGDMAIALKQAQSWLRDLTLEEFEQLLERLKPQLDKVFAQLRPGQRLIIKELLKQMRQRGEKPFANPYYWAAFTAVGV